MRLQLGVVLVVCGAWVGCNDPPPPAPHHPGLSQVHGPTASSLKLLHEGQVSAFEERAGFGISRTVTFPASRFEDSEGNEWELESYDLVGLDGEPRVFALEDSVHSGSTATMDPPTHTLRELDAFELMAVESLRREPFMHSKRSGEQLRVLGAIRATREQCASCHGVAEGDVLGAFSYRFRRVAGPQQVQ